MKYTQCVHTVSVVELEDATAHGHRKHDANSQKVLHFFCTFVTQAPNEQPPF